ncbi:MAG: beta-galactosidase [Cyclobacteriaceae bacterium]
MIRASINFSKLILLITVYVYSLSECSGQSRFTGDDIRSSLGNAMMPIGAYYYPEHWDDADWEADLKRMVSLGFEFTHFGEFAWSRMEPVEGQYDFEWLDRVVAIAGKYGLKVIMCTPSPTPPAWLTRKYPEILSVDKNLLKQQHGGRLHAIYNHPTYLKYVEKIVTKLAQRYGNNPTVVGWQLDNEPHFGPIYDYSDQAAKEFPRWLEKKYGKIEALNKSWGTAFWSQTYNSFDQIGLPNAVNTPQGANPHGLLDFSRFTADRLADALRFQANLLRKYISKDQWVTTNYAYFKFLSATDPFRNKNDLNFASHTMYLTSGYLNDHGSEKAFRLGSGLELSFSNELAKSVNGRTGIMELQPGQINWGTINPQPLPGAVRMWIWHSYGLGDEFTCAYRFRQPLFGS